MAYEFKLDEAAASEVVGGGAFGTLDTGIYGVTINHASLDKDNFKNDVVNISITTDSGHETTIWGLGIGEKNENGSENFDYKKWQSLAKLGGMKTGETAPFKITKEDGALIKEVVVFKELMGKKLKMAIQKVFWASKDFSKDGENNEIYAVYSEDGRNVAEMNANGSAENIEKVGARLKDKETKSYKAMIAKGGSKPAQANDIDEDEVPF